MTSAQDRSERGAQRAGPADRTDVGRRPAPPGAGPVLAGDLGAQTRDPRQLLAWQRSVGNAAVTALLGQAGSGQAGTPVAASGSASAVQRQVAEGRYRLNAEGHLREDDEGHTQLATLPKDSRVEVLDKGGRTSLFKAGWFVTNEHSWSEAPDRQVGWVDDAKLEYSLADELEATFGRNPTIGDLQLIIRSKTAEQKKRAADDEAFLSRARTALDEDTYLELLPALGVHRAPSGSQLSQGGSAHTTGPEADRVIRQYLQQYVAEAVRAGRKVEGEVSVVGDEDFQMAFDRQWVRAAGQSFGTQKAWEVCNAFVDVNLPNRRIWVHRDKGDTGTVIHEGMHKYADATLRDEQIVLAQRLGIVYGGISQLDEGITEYFTRLVVGQLRMRQRVNYQNPYVVAAKLARRFGERTLAQAYFDGRFAALQRAVGTDWAAFAEALERKDWMWLSAHGFT